MPITQGPTSTSSAGSGVGATTGLSASPFASMLGGLNLGNFQFNTGGANANTAPTFQNIMAQLTQQPASVTNNLMPGLSQILGLQTSSMLPYMQQQTGQNVAQQQSMAQQRGLTGSSIEAAGMLGAQSAGNMAQNQFIGQQLGTLGQAYTGAVSQDTNTQNQMYQNIAQALGQQMQSQMEQQQFQQMLAQQMDMANTQGRTALQSSLIQGGMGMAGMLGGAAILCDQRLKTNMVPLGKIKGLTLYSFEYKQDAGLDLPPGQHFGFMAQDVEKKFPCAVMEAKGYKFIDLAKFVPLMQEA